VLWVLTAPELADRFVRRRGWTLDSYEAWLAGAVSDALLGPGSAAPGAGAAAGR
jgi:hypothetical protein